MAEITAQMVKELREKTGAGMGDCKKALEKAEGNMEVAIDELRKKGAASVAKRADRAAKEGLILVKVSSDGKKASLVEVSCETDFVARNEEFVTYAKNVSIAFDENNVASLEDLLKCNVAGDTVQGLHNGILAKFAEKIEISRYQKFETAGYIVDYIHAGSKLAVIVDFSLANPSDEAIVLMRDIAMQIAAMNPLYLDRTKVDQAAIEKEIQIAKEFAINEGKKPEIAERIAQGKLEKYYQEQCLLEQAFVKDGSKTVNDVVADISKIAGTEVKINSFSRIFLGETA